MNPERITSYLKREVLAARMMELRPPKESQPGYLKGRREAFETALAYVRAGMAATRKEFK